MKTTTTRYIMYPVELRFNDGGTFTVAPVSKAIAQLLFDKGLVFQSEKEAMDTITGTKNTKWRYTYPSANLIESKYPHNKCFSCGKEVGIGMIRYTKNTEGKGVVFHDHCWLNG